MIVFITDPIPELAMKQLTDAGFTVRQHPGSAPITKSELLASVSDVDYLVTSLSTNVDADVIAAAPQLKLIANYGAGYNNIDTVAAAHRGIAVTNTPAVSTESVAELTLGLILALSHRVVEGDQLMRTTGFAGWQPLFFLGHEIAGKRLGIVGMGSIGRAVAQRARALGMEILYWQRHRLAPSDEQAAGAHFSELDELLAASDFVTLHVPIVPSSRHLIDAEALARMKDSAYLINAARGPVVDEAALASALESGSIAGAALDVYEREPEPEPALKGMKNVILTPHIGNATVEARNAMAQIVVNNIVKQSRGEKINTVNLQG
jgi:D-3-phosphoglycerate dehydrogenase